MMGKRKNRKGKKLGPRILGEPLEGIKEDMDCHGFHPMAIHIEGCSNLLFEGIVNRGAGLR